MKIAHKKILIVGTGISGISAAKLIKSLGGIPILYDENKNLKSEDIYSNLSGDKEIEVIVGDFPQHILDALDLVIVSPGVPMDSWFIKDIRLKQIEIIGEIELGYLFGKGRILAVTGTNGKTTTTALLGEIIKNHFKEVYVVGNIGIPYTGIITDMTEEAVTVAEVSSFQLESIKAFRPDVSAVLNISPDHLNRHKAMENYIEAKKNIAKNQTEKDTCVLNYDDGITRDMGKNLKAKVLYFSRLNTLDNGVYLKNGNIFYHNGSERALVCSLKELKLLGNHNVENVMAAVAMAISVKVPIDKIRESVINFQGVEHRIEYVTEKNGVKYYNDSKGTNPDAAIKGIQAMVRPTVLIGGGYDKESVYEEWIQSFDGKVKLLILIGETKNKIAEAARHCGFYSIEFADSLEDAVKLASRASNTGDAVLLSPACASWGMFKNYEERGRNFKDYVFQLEG